MPYIGVSFDLGAIASDAAEEACFAAGALAVTFTDAGDDPVLEPAPGEVRLWPATRVEALYPADADPAVLAHTLAAALRLSPVRIETATIADREWALEWQDRFHAMRFGRRLWVAPSHEPITEPGAAVVQLDPGLAFGTGTHPSTAMCLRWLDAHPPAGLSLIDYGCGSGILAIAALRLDAASAEAFDIDAQALTAPAENATRNGVADRLRTVTSADALAPGADLLIANILSGPLEELAPRFAALVRPGGSILLAGLLAPEAAEVTEAYRAWFDMCRFEECEDWVSLAGSRTPPAETCSPSAPSAA